MHSSRVVAVLAALGVALGVLTTSAAAAQALQINVLSTRADLVSGGHPSPCTVAEGLEAGWIAEAATRSLHEHRPAGIAEVRPPTAGPVATLTAATSERSVS